MWFRINFAIFFIKLLSVIIKIECETEILRPRGVSFSKKIFYNPNKDFTCLDGSLSIPFIMVNDDYCDCNDGSDEPGTSACPNARFHCSNIGYVERLIPTSRVNDGICDCCDASDEYNSSAQCVNNCMELGEQMRKERDLQMKVIEEGKKIRDQYIEQAKSKIEESKNQLEELKKLKTQVEEEKNAKEAIKRDAEEREKAALEKFKAAEDKLKQQKEEEEMLRIQEEEKKSAQIAFKELDLNNDNILSYTEVQKFPKFDKDGDGVVSDEEAKFYLHAKDEMDNEEFVTTGWIIMKPYYLRDITTETPVPSDKDKLDVETNNEVPEVENVETDNSQTDANIPEEERETPADEEEEEEEDQPPYIPPKDAELLESSTQADQTPEYDEETKTLIEHAKKAKDEYSEIEGKFLDAQNKVRELEVLLETDFGPDKEFMPLQGQCFDLSNNEYTYTFCPFDKAVQKPKHGSGGEINLGRWGQWTGHESKKYEKMKLDGGTACWNGPARSVVVNLNCGVTNELTSVSEPSRCEYEFDFSTPALCVPVTQTHDVHDEL